MRRIWPTSARVPAFRRMWTHCHCCVPGRDDDSGICSECGLKLEPEDTASDTDITERAYQLGRARGACYLRTEATEADDEWCAEQIAPVDDDDEFDAALVRFAEGMLDGCEQAHYARMGMKGTPPPSAEEIAAARDPR